MQPELPESLRAFIAEAPLQRGPIARAVAGAAAACPPGTRVLDAGAGDAPYRPLFAHCDYRTQDWPGTVHAGGRAADVVADLHELPPDLGGFGLVLCTEVLEHVADPGRVLCELHRVLEPGGRLLVTVPFVGALHEEPYDFQRLTNHGLARLLARAGFDQVRIVPLTGFWSTLAHLLRFAALATQRVGEPPPIGPRVAGAAALVASIVLAPMAPRLDRLDRRRALPVGWLARARRPEPASGRPALPR